MKVRQDKIVDTLSTAMVNIKMCLDEMTRAMSDKGELIQREVID